MAPIFLAGGSADQRFACRHVPSSAEQRDETSARMALSFTPFKRRARVLGALALDKSSRFRTGKMLLDELRVVHGCAACDAWLALGLYRPCRPGSKACGVLGHRRVAPRGLRAFCRRRNSSAPSYPPCAVRASVAAWPHQKPHWLPPHQRTIKCARAGQCRCKTESSRRPAVSSRSTRATAGTGGHSATPRRSSACRGTRCLRPRTRR